MIESNFTLTPEQVELLGLDGTERWFGVLGQKDDEDEDRRTFVTISEAAYEALVNALDSDGLEPPAEFMEWLDSAFLIVPGWPSDW